MNQGIGTQVKIKFRGLPGPIEEQLLVKSLFQNNPRWKKLSLDIIASDYISYQALFLGLQEKIFREFVAPQNAPFEITAVFWEDTFLVVDVKWKEITESLEPFLDTMVESGLAELDSVEENLPKPNLQVPLRTFKQTYNLPLPSTVYDHIRHRGDSTLFRIEPLNNTQSKETNKVTSLSWFRIGPTNLRPKLTLYDQNRKRIKSYMLRKKKQFLFKYKIPEGKQAFYLRISDEVGFLKDVAGSYQSFRYVLTVN